MLKLQEILGAQKYKNFLGEEESSKSYITFSFFVCHSENPCLWARTLKTP